MTTLCIILAVIVLIALLRFCVTAEYSAGGIEVRVKVGPFSVFTFPGEEKSDRKKKKDKTKEKKPGGAKAFLEMLPSIKESLLRLRRKLFVKRLTIHFTAAGKDPAAAALSFGAVNAAFGAVTPVFENNFRIRRRDFQAFADFDRDQPSIYVNAVLSVAVWEAVYVLIALLPILKSNAKREKAAKT